MFQKTWIAAVATTVILGGGTAVAAEPGVFHVSSFGAVADGVTNTAPAVNSAVDAAHRAGGGVVTFDAGTYLLAGTVHLKSNVTIEVKAGSTIVGSKDGYDPPEDNPYDKYQDYGHSHFHNAMFYGDKVDNVRFIGQGTIDGGGGLITGNPKKGQADKIISITRCTNFELSGIRMRRGGHFAALINGCTGVTSDKLFIDTASDRDGWNIISTRNVKITNIRAFANDDALAFKSDYALGQKLPNGNVTVTNAELSAKCCNALMFGSETCGDFTGYNFSDIKITGAGKSGLGLVSMDGAVISDVHYKNITMSGTKSPIMIKVGTRKRCGNNPGVGKVHDITYENITGTSAGSFSPTIWGEPGSISDITFTNVNLNLPGGSGTMSTNPPSNDPKNYNPNSIGTRPAFGWYIHNATNLKFVNSSVKFSKNDGRPAVIANGGSKITFEKFTAQRGSNSPSDLLFQNVSGFCVKDSANTSGGELRVGNSGSSNGC
ncbi:glycoside hydrolase [Lentzea sp. NBRC 105346]|uniref:glycoside hydrolase family 28 protein n=1 Tax=Lentzea sp. NBRC 105346 TaxID=3032205 RepID=UPI0024A1C6EB|nr:glycosyl hydrolase family 28 protein [Lentzea sp. NBRC 105346]GLZ36359.1 glycoside hydrolase [Lentzea sp. NBRC 105346]